MVMWTKIVRGLSLAMILASSIAALVLAQTKSSVQPYATMDRVNVSFEGTGRDKESDIRSDTINIGLVLPLQGSQARHGKLLLEAARLALEEANANGVVKGTPRFALSLRNESERWGQTSAAIVQLIVQDEVVVIISAGDGSVAHQAEQIANKLGVPVLTLSSDPTTTRINIPWIFRVGPSDADEARAIVADLSQTGKSRRVLIIAESDHDGRIGGDEFAKVATSYGAPPLGRIDIDLANFSLTDLFQQIDAKKPDAVVLWSGPELAEQIWSGVPNTNPSIKLYLSQKSGAFLFAADKVKSGAQIVLPGSNLKNEEFSNLYKARTGVEPGLAAEQMYTAVHTALNAILSVGTNRARVRDCLASPTRIGEVPGTISFDLAGNSLGTMVLIQLNGGANVASADAPGRTETK
jgi:branched-chain amino acid transport system substrate-binding protein